MPVSANTKPIKPQQTPWTCVTPPQTSGQSSHNIYPEPASHLRKLHTNQAMQITHTCDWGGVAPLACMRTLARVCAHLQGHARQPWSCTGTRMLHGHGHTFTGMRTPSRACARPWSSGTPSTRPAAGLRKSPTGSVTQVHWAGDRSTQIYIQPAHSNPNVQPLGGMGMASLGDASASATTATSATTGGASTCVMVRPEGRTCDRARWPDYSQA